MPQMLESEVGLKTSRASGFRTVPRRGCERRAGLLSLIIAASLADQHPWPVEYGAIPRRRNPQAGCSYATARNPGRPSACFSLVDRDGPRSDKRLSGEVRVLRRRLGRESQAPDRGTHFRIFRADEFCADGLACLDALRILALAAEMSLRPISILWQSLPSS